MRHSVTADFHARAPHFPDLIRIHEKRFTKTTGTYEKNRAEPAPQEGGNDVGEIRNIAIIHREADLRMLFHQIENRFEKIRIKPAIKLSLLYRTRERPDTVKIKNTGTHREE